ncbi:nucleoside/nucleotide kinase family protein [Microbacterium halotolerans]|uniref:nucleoside/nucleotide kinase family protein n=1 Tax=Microbacterium halotolerans TaxID=246613 RepID=UPI000E6ACBE7|nr:nucleoside/nucleotide kinase family protein [Microbacterium halotolerans]
MSEAGRTTADAGGASDAAPDGPAAEVATIDDLRARVRDLAATGIRRIIGITGAPGAGKSTVAEALVADGVSVLVGMDGYHFADRLLHARGLHDRKGAPHTFDVDGFVSLLERIRAQGPDDGELYAPYFDRELDEPIGSCVPVRADVPVVIVEGNYLLHDADGWEGVRDLLDEAWFLDPGDDTRVERLIARHERFGRGRAEALERATGSDELNAQLIRATRSLADRVFSVR